MPVVLALLSSLMWGTADFLGGTLTRRAAAIGVVAYSQAAALVVFAAVGVSFGDLDVLPDVLPVAAGAGIAGGAALVAFYAALARGTMGVVAPLAALGVLVPVVVGIAAGDRPTSWQWLGMALGIAGGVLAAGPQLRLAAARSSIALALLAGVGFGIALVLIGEGGQTDPLMTMLGMRLVSVPLLFTALGAYVVRARATARAATPPQPPTRHDPARAPSRLRVGDVPLVVAVGLLDGGANLAYSAAVGAGGLLSLMAVLGSLYPAVTVVLARIVHGERLTHVQAVGVLATLLGVGLIAGG